MDVSFNNVVSRVLEGTREFFMGVPKPAQADGSGQPLWPNGPPPEEGAPAQSGAPAPSSRPPSAAAAPPSVPTSTSVTIPPRPPSEPLEPEPHIIHKATVMREAAEKRREQPEIEDDEEVGTLSPPSHIIRKPQRTMPSPAPAPAAPCPSPARPPSAAPLPPPEATSSEAPPQYRQTVHRVQTPTSRQPDHYASGRPPDPYQTARPPDPYTMARPSEPYGRYPYDAMVSESSRNSHGSVGSPQPSAQSRPSPQTYARLSGSMPQHNSRLREVAESPPAQRYPVQTHPPPPTNDRVPPIHHPQPAQRHTSESRAQQFQYTTLHQRREISPYPHGAMHYDRHPTVPQRKYDQQHAYPSYRPSPGSQPLPNHSVDAHHPVAYKHMAVDAINVHYPSRSQERSPVPIPQHPHDPNRLPTRSEYPKISRTVDSRSSYHYPSPSPSTSRYGPTAPVQVVPNTSQPRVPYRQVATAPKPNYEYPPLTPVQTSPARANAKPTVSVTSIVHEMNQTKQKQDTRVVVSSATSTTKQKRESPLDLSVKTVKNSADSSTTQDEGADVVTTENKMLLTPHRPSSSSRHAPLHTTNYVASHKVDFAPNFTQYGDRSESHGASLGVSHGASHSAGHSASHSANHAASHGASVGASHGASHSYVPAPTGHPSSRYNGAYETRRPNVESLEPYRHQDISKYPSAVRPDYVPKIDLTRAVSDQRHSENRIRDDRHFIIEDRKRLAGPICSNIPEKIVRYETWTADSRIDHLNKSAREQQELMRQPVYSYSRHKQLEAYQNEQKRPLVPGHYREHHTYVNTRYPNSPYHGEIPVREPVRDYHAHYHDRHPSVNNHHNVIQKNPSQRNPHPHQYIPPSGIPANKRVLSILRRSLETKQTGFVEQPRQAKQIPDLIVIDDGDDCVIEITDLTKDNETESGPHAISKHHNNVTPNFNQHIKMPKAVDSLPRDFEYNNSPEPKRKTPEIDVASRIRTKAELKVMPPSQDNINKTETKRPSSPEHEKLKLLPRKTHLFNQIREDNLRLESVIKNEMLVAEVKSEPMNIDEIEKDAEILIKTEPMLDNHDKECTTDDSEMPADDLDWASACDNFMEQLKTGCHKKKPLRKRVDTIDNESESKQESVQTRDQDTEMPKQAPEPVLIETLPPIVIKQEPIDEDELKLDNETNETSKPVNTEILKEKPENPKCDKKSSKNKEKEKDGEKPHKPKAKPKVKTEKIESSTSHKKDINEKPENNTIKTVIKEETESTDDDEPLIKSKILKEKEQSARMKYQLLKDLSEKSAYVKLECCDVDVNKNTRKSLDSVFKDKDEKQKGKLKQSPRIKGKLSTDDKKSNQDLDSSSDSDDDISVASRLRMRKNTKTEDTKLAPTSKTPVKSPLKKHDSSSTSSSSTPVRKLGLGDNSYFHPGWEEELYKYKRSLRMPTRLIAIPRGRSGGPFVRGAGVLFSRGSTSLPDLDPAPLSPAPSSTPSAATDDLYARRPDKLTLDSDLDSNSSYSAPNKLHYDSEASTSTVFSSRIKKKSSSIVDVLIKKCGKREETKKDKKSKDKDDKTPKVIKKATNDLLPTPSLGLVKNGDKGNYNIKKEKLMEDIFYLGAFRKETVTAFRNSFIKDTDGLIGATEEFAPVVLKTRTRTESRVLKHRATIKEVFGDERPASAPPSSCREEEVPEEKEEKAVEIKKEPDSKPKFKPKKIVKDKLKRRSSSIRDGLRSTISLKRNDAKGRLMRLKKRNSMMKSVTHKKIKDIAGNKLKNDNAINENKDTTKIESSSLGSTEVKTKRRLKRLFRKGKFSSGFDYIRKKKKIRREESGNKIRRPASKPSPESVHDIRKEIKGWFINKSIGETHLHRAARLGYTDCIAYCLEKMESDPSAKDNAGFTPLHVAAAKGHVRIARLLLQYGANVSAAAQGGIRPLHEACENSHVEIIRLLLAYGADPLLGTYAGQTPEELTDEPAATLIRLHIADVQGFAVEPWRFPPLTQVIDHEEIGCDPLLSPPPSSPLPAPDATIEIQCTDAPLPPFYSLKTGIGQPFDGLWCILADVTSFLQIKSKESLLKQIHCGSGSPKELLREIRTQEFLERAQCQQLLCAGEKVNVRASKVALVRVTDKLRQLLKIETVLVS